MSLLFYDAKILVFNLTYNRNNEVFYVPCLWYTDCLMYLRCLYIVILPKSKINF